MITDAELLRRYVEDRTEDAFGELVRRHLNLVYSAARRQVGGDAHLAEDVTQSVFADLAKKAPGLCTRPTPLNGWLYTSTHFAAAKLVRGEQRRKIREREAHAMHDADTPPMPEATWEQLRPVLDDVMHEMNEREREAVLLRFFDQLPLADVGRRLGLSENTAAKAVERAMEKLRSLLAQRGITSTSAALAWVLAEQAVVAAPASLASTVIASTAGGATVGAAGVTGLQLMALTKTTLTLAGLTLAVGAGIAFFQWQANPASPATAGQPHAVQLRAQPVPAPTLTSGQTPASVAPRPVKAAPKVATVAAAEVTADQASTALPHPLANPETAKRIADDRAVTVRRYTPFYEKLGLTPEQSEKMTALLMDNREAGVDFAAAAARHGSDVSGNHQAFVGTVSELRAKIDGEIRTLLGPAGYEQFLEADLAIRQEAVVERLQTTGQPAVNAHLTPEQAGMMLALLREMGVYNLNDEVVSRARAFLAPSQIDSLLEMQRRQKLGPKKEKVQQAIQENLPTSAPASSGKG